MSRICTFMLFCLFLKSMAQAQMYPVWFLNQGNLDCHDSVVGYTQHSYFADSSAAYAVRDGYLQYARQNHVQIKLDNLYRQSALGVGWVAGYNREFIDSTLISIARDRLVPQDTLYLGEWVAVLLTGSLCVPEPGLKSKQSVRHMSKPNWIKTLPDDPDYIYAIGVSRRMYNEKNSWQYAEKMARRELASTASLEIAASQKLKNETIVAASRGKIHCRIGKIETHSRWFDVQENFYYVLVRARKQSISIIRG